MEQIARFVRRKDFDISLLLKPEDTDRQNELIDAIFVVKPSLLIPRLMIEVYQPVIGDVANTIFRMCRNGVALCGIKTLTPNRAYTDSTTICGHITYLLRNGRVSFHENYMTRDAIEADDFMVHTIQIEFETMKVQTNKARSTSSASKKRKHSLTVIRGGRE